MAIVDSHVHVWSDDLVRYPWHPPEGVAPPQIPGSVEYLLELMDQSGVDKAVLVHTTNYGWDHSYALDCCQSYPSRFAVVGLADPWDRSAPDTLERLVQAQGVGGLRLLPYHTPNDWGWFNHPAIYPLWEEAAKLQVPINVAIHPHQMAALEDMVARFPTVSVLIDHMGCQDPEESPSYPSAGGLLRLGEYPNAYVKISAFRLSSKAGYPYDDCSDLVERIWRRFGASRLLWGTEFPYVQEEEGYGRCLQLMDRFTFLADSDREWILGKTALSLYNFDPDRFSGSTGMPE